MNNKVCVYPGTFDPITNGHMDVIERAKKIFDKVIVAIAVSENKKPMFYIDKRVEMAKMATKDIPGVEVFSFNGLLVNFCQQNDITTIVRGLRAVSDFEYELQIGYTNSSLDKNIDTLYLMPSLQNAFISSTIVRDILRHHGNFEHLVPASIKNYLKDQACM
ncbi:MAG TPA: pantetheine-phosphate adenylyltransferase [Sulfurospirillum sp. UBA12182]|jgi:pantetheine-phosphate adenylyltransferase|nr:MAG TPA: pantetheine-phosphate adenylyltransferase [Sulfurospirillum sp. UBA12182]